MMLKNKKILLGVTGSISAYKACEIARGLMKHGAQVHVVLSQGAQRFVTALTFEALTRNQVLTEQSESWSSELNHIELGRKCDLFLIAPATANSINKIAKGVADTLLTQCALAFKGPIVIAPAANTQMLQNHYTQGSLKMLGVNDVHIIEPQSKRLACNEEGTGALAEIDDIIYGAARALLTDSFWQNRRVVVTAGGTQEPIDQVRYISNYSSGKMGHALALELYLQGADVCLISTKPTTHLPSDLYTIDVSSAQEMYEFTIDAVRVAKKGVVAKSSLNNPQSAQVIHKRPYLFMVAAVADYTPAYPQSGKLKKSQLGEQWTLELKQTQDILQAVDKNNLITIGFKAEMDSQTGLDNAKAQLKEKGVDGVCYNLLKDAMSFGGDENEITFITPKETTPLGRDSKSALSKKIVALAKVLDE